MLDIIQRFIALLDGVRLMELCIQYGIQAGTKDAISELLKRLDYDDISYLIKEWTK